MGTVPSPSFFMSAKLNQSGVGAKNGVMDRD